MSEFNEEVISQLAAVRETGATNMMDKSGVRLVADQCGFDELVAFCDMASNKEFIDHLTEMGERR